MASHVLVWIHAGPLAGKWRPLSRQDAERAEREGWGQIAPRRAARIKAEPGPHDAADAYWGGRGYMHRELRAAPGSPPAHIPVRDTPELPPTMQAEDEAEPPKRPRGRPRKAE